MVGNADMGLKTLNQFDSPNTILNQKELNLEKESSLNAHAPFRIAFLPQYIKILNISDTFISIVTVDFKFKVHISCFSITLTSFRQ